MAHIRRISVHVDEPDPGHFHWVLMEGGDDASHWRELASAQGGYDLWLDALHAGNKALLDYVVDERIGPRQDGENENAAPVLLPVD